MPTRTSCCLAVIGQHLAGIDTSCADHKAKSYQMITLGLRADHMISNSHQNDTDSFTTLLGKPHEISTDAT